MPVPSSPCGVDSPSDEAYPLPDLDAVTLEHQRARTTIKWTRHGPDVLPAWVADMDFPIAEPIAEAIERWVRRRDFAYRSTEIDDRVKVGVVEWQERRHGIRFDPGLVHLLHNGVQAIHLLTLLASAPGDGIAVMTPAYHPFLTAVDEHGRRLLEVRLRRIDDTWAWDGDDLERVGAQRPPLMFLCNPHNPTGRVFTRNELERLAEWAARYDVLVVSDEIHADLVHGHRRHIPFASLGAEVAARTITLTSASKTFNLASTHLAFVILGGAGLADRFADLSSHAHGRVGELGMVAALAAWEHGERWLAHVRGYLTANRDHLAGRLSETAPGVGYVPPEATYLAWLDFRETPLGDDPAEVLLREAKVALSRGFEFGEAGRGFARLNFATSRAMLDEIVARIGGSLAAPSPPG